MQSDYVRSSPAGATPLSRTLNAKTLSSVALAFFALLGCEPSTSPPTPPTPPSFDPVSKIAIPFLSLIFDSPIFKLLKAYEIVKSANYYLAQKEYESYQQSQFSIETNNPGVTWEVDARSIAEPSTFQTPTSAVAFSPSQFALEHSLQISSEQGGGDVLALASQQSLRALDDRIAEDYRSCSGQVLTSHQAKIARGNQIRLLELRLECLASKGYSTNTINYARIKLL